MKTKLYQQWLFMLLTFFCCTFLTTESVLACNNCTNGGSISTTGTSGCSPYDPPQINNASSPSGGSGTLQIVWIYKNASTSWAFQVISGATSLTYNPDPITETTTFRRCARRSGCTDYVGESNDITFTVNNCCSNVTSGGSIGSDQSGCSPFNPVAFTSASSPSGGSGTLEIVWIYKSASTGWAFQMISGANALTYDAGAVTETTIFRRCARRAGCTDYVGESNDVTVTVYPNPTVSLTTVNGNCSNGNRGSVTANPSGGTSPYTYLWSNGATTSSISNLLPGTYSVTVTDAHNCNVASSSTTTTITCCNVTSPGSIGYNQNLCGSYDPDEIVSIALPMGGVGPIEYVWLKSTVDGTFSNAANYSVIPGANGPSYDPGVVSQTTWFRRCARNLGCTSYVGESNIVEKKVSPSISLSAVGYDNTVNCRVASTCVLTAYSGSGNHAFWLPDLGLSSPSFYFANPGGYLVRYTNGTAHLTGVIYSTVDANKKFKVDIWFRGGYNWSQWSGLGRSYKDEANVATAGAYYTGWTYFEMDDTKPNTLTGINGYAGTNLNLTHNPSNYNFGFQIGDRANSKNTNYGMSGWFSYSGSQSGNGDINTDGNCTQTNCNGSAYVTVSGGSGNTTYSWSNGATTPVATSLCAGTYTVNVTDGSCSASTTVTIGTSGSLPTVSINPTNGTCSNGNLSSACAVPSGGQSPYTYLWSNGATSDCINNVAAGTYSVTVTDAYGCQVSSSVTLSNQTCCNFTSGGTIGYDESQCGSYDPSNIVSITLPSGGTGATEFVWLISTVDGTFSNSANYSVIPGATNASYDPGVITQTTWFRRCARRAGCTSYVGESNIIVKTVKNNPSANCTPTPSTCTASNGSVCVTATGGTGSYSYSWSNSGTGSCINNLAAGFYSVTVTDGNNCTATCSSTVQSVGSTVTAAVVTGSLQNATCYQVCNGSVSIEISIGTPPFSFTLNGNSSFSYTTIDPTHITINQLCAGTYTLIITDYNGCTGSVTFTIGEPNPIIVNVSPSNGNCQNGNTGSLCANATGGTGSYTYLWSNGETTQCISGLTSGSYSVIVSDGNNCSSASTSGSVTTETCCNYTDGGTIGYDQAVCGSYDPDEIVNITSPSGGLGGSEIIWITRAYDNASGLGYGSWSVIPGATNLSYDPSTIASSQQYRRCARRVGCTEYIGESNIITKIVYDQPSVYINKTDGTCSNNNLGSACAVIIGGTSSFNYLWSNGSTTDCISGLLAGQYSVTITDGNNCSAQTSITIETVPCCNYTDGGQIGYDQSVCGAFDPDEIVNIAPPTGGLGGSDVIWIYRSTSVTSWTVIPGATSLSYDPGTIMETTEFRRCARRSGCTDYIGESNIVIKTVLAIPTISITPTNGTCQNGNVGSACAVVSGAATPYTLAWSNSESTQCVNNLAAGSISVTVTDDNGCQATANENITVTPCCNFTDGGTIGYDQAVCGGYDPDQIQSLTLPSGGYGATEFVWLMSTVDGTFSNPANYTVIPGATNASYDPGSISQTTWFRRCARRAGCTSYVGESNNVVKIVNAIPSVVINVVNGSCNNENLGSAMAVVSGGTSPYAYDWSNDSTTASISNLEAGTYCVDIIDANGCTATTCEEISTTPCCNYTDGGTIGYDQSVCGSYDPDEIVNITSPSGGLGGSEIIWITRGYDNATSSGIGSWSVIPGATNLSYDPSTITSSQQYRRCARRVGCTDYIGESNIITKIVLALPTVTVQSTNGTCTNGNVGELCAVVSGVGPYSYLWDCNEATSQCISNLSAVTCSVTVTDGNGCSASASGSVTTVACCNYTDGGTIGYDQSVCGAYDPDEIVNITSPSGGIGTPDIIWITRGYDNATSSGIGSWSVIAGATNLSYDPSTITSSQQYRRCARRAGCTDYIGESNIITKIVWENPSVTCTPVNGNCQNGNVGSVSANVSGGTAPYSYLWSDGSTGSSISNLSAGTYYVIITDAHGCVATCTTQVTITPCCNFTDGGEIGYEQAQCSSFDPDELVSISLPSGGYGATEFIWIYRSATVTSWTVIPGATNSSYDPGVVTETTEFRRCARRSGCTQYLGESNIITITVYPPVDANITVSGPTSFCTGNSVTLTATGGTMFSWNTGETTASITVDHAGTYSVTVYDVNECSDSASVTVQVFNNPTPYIVANGPTTFCSGGSVTLHASDGVEFEWSTGETTQDIVVTTSGHYTVFVKDFNGCIGYASIDVTVNPSPVIASIVRTNGICANGNVGSINITISGGTTPYTYLWSNGATTQNISGLANGTYSVTVTDASGCTATASSTIQNTPCCNFTSGGEIGVNESRCGSYDPQIIVNVSLPSGGSGGVEYVWLMSTVNGLFNNSANYTVIPGATNSSYDPGVITQTTWFRRCARRAGCTSYVGESNVVVKTVWSNPTATCTPTDGTCQNNLVASASVTASGGTSPYTYLWSNGGTTSSISNLAAGSYSVVVTDANGCTATCTTTVAITPCCNYTDGGSIGYNQAVCGAYDPDEIVNITSPSGGIGTPDIIWITRAYDNATSSGIGSWSVIAGATNLSYDPSTITSSRQYRRCARRAGCTDYIAESNIITKIVWDTPTATCTPTDGTCQNNLVASASVTASGGTSPYTYLWSNGATTSSISNLAAGSYSVVVTDANGCTATCTTTVAITPCCNYTSGGTIGYDQSVCGAYDPDEIVNITSPSGGIGTPDIIWITRAYDNATSSGIGSWSVIPGATSLSYDPSTITSSRQYRRCARRAGCTDYIAESNIVTKIVWDTPTAACTPTDGTCQNNLVASASVTASGGTSPYTYLWSNGSTSSSISNLAAGSYSVVVTDAHGCTATCTTTVAITPCCNYTNGGTIGYNQALCGAYDPDEIVNITSPSGGSGASQIIWIYRSTTVTSWTVIPGATSLSYDPGTITETTEFRRCARRAGCTDYIGESNIVVKTVRNAPIVTCTPTDGTCQNNLVASASVLASGGTAPYTYLWSNGATSSSISNLAAGSYSVVVTDANGCSATCTTTVAITPCCNFTSGGQIGYNQALCGAYDPTNIVSISLPSGGSGATEYVWLKSIVNGNFTNPADYVVIAGATNSSYDPGVITQTTWFRRCARRAGCTQYIGESNVIKKTVYNAPTVTCSGVNGTCQNNLVASASVTASGGTSPYTYLWSNGGTTSSITNLAAGTYSVTVSDVRGCQSTCTTTVAITPCCNYTSGGTIGYDESQCGSYDPSNIVSITLPSGGSGATEFVWLMSTVDGTFSNSANYTVIPGATNSSYDPGVITQTTWFRRCARRAGCTSYVGESNNVVKTVWSNPTATCTPTDGTCQNNLVASASVTASGGTSPYTYLWSNGSTSSSISNLAAGSYSVVVTDAHGCTATCTTTVAITPCCNYTDGGSIGYDQSLCGAYDPDEIVNITSPSGGIGTPDIIWITRAYDNATSSGIGSWSVIAGATGLSYDPSTITSSRQYRRCARRAGCTDYIAESNIITKIVWDTPTAACTPTDGTCQNNLVASASVTAGGGTAPYTYLWSNGAITSSISNLAAGSYSVVVTDAHGCTATCTTTVAITPCCNYTDGGSIGYDQSLCGAYDPDEIVNITSPSGGSGASQIIWITRAYDNATSSGVGSWSVIAGATNLSYDPSTITSSRQYRRCARRAGCTDYIAESNIITKIVWDTPTVTHTNYGQVCDTLTSGIILSGGSPSGGFYYGTGVVSGVFYPAVAGLGVHTLSYKYIDNHGCFSTATFTIEVIHCVCPLPNPPTIVGVDRLCAPCTNVQFQASGAIGATNYIWTVPAGVTITAGQGTSMITLSCSNTFNGGNVCVTASNSCGSIAQVCKPIYKATVKPTNIGPISGPSVDVCAGGTYQYCIPGSIHASSYAWTATGGITVATGQNTSCITINVPAGFTSGTLTVQASNCVGLSEKVTYTIYGIPAVNSYPIQGPLNACVNSTVSYCIPVVAGTTNYIWSVPTGATIVSGQGTRCISVSFDAIWTRGYITVVCSSACGGNSKSYFIRSTPDQPLTGVTGPVTNLCNASGVVFSVAAQADATMGYFWTVPSGASIVSGQGTTSITVNFGVFSTGNVCVSSVNSCGNSAPRCLSVSGRPATPCCINGLSIVCPNAQGVVYTIASEPGVSYQWTVPTGATIVSGQGTPSITVNWGTIAGNVTVKPTNACGQASVRTLPVIMNCRMATGIRAGEITSLNAYPNPVVNDLTISFNSAAMNNYTLTMTDVIGKPVYSTNGTASEGNNVNEINVKGFAKGLYIVTITSGDTKLVTRVVVE